MAIENETADQVVRMVLQGSEVVLRLSGEAGMRIATMIYNALKGDLTTKGKATLWEFLLSGKDQKLFTIPDEYLKAFTRASKKFGFPFVVLKDKASKTGMTDIMVYASDASKVSRVIENLKLNVDRVNTLKPEVVTEAGELIKPLGMQYSVPFDLIDGIPDTPKNDKRLLAELQKYAAKLKKNGPQFADPIGLLCKPDGRYELLAGQGAKRIMALRLAGYKEAVADIMVPKKEGIEVKAENVDKRPSQERHETTVTVTPVTPEPTKEEPQTVNPTMARTSGDPASGQGFEKSLKTESKETSITDPKDRPSVREKLKECKKIADEENSGKKVTKTFRKITPKPKSDLR